MSATTPDAIVLARTLASQFANEAPWTLRGDFDSDDAIGQVAIALDATVEDEQEAFLAELEPLVPPDLHRRLSDFFGRIEAYGQDGGYLFGLAVGQLIHLPALAPRKNGDAR